jgi:hypothetical protein
VNPAFELGVFREGKELLELGAGGVAGGDEIASSDERSRPDLMLGSGLIARFREFIEREITVAGQDVHSVQGEVLREVVKTEESLEGGGLHLLDVAEAHVVLDEGDDLGGFVVGETEAVKDRLGNADADLDVSIEAYAARAGLEGGWLADVVKECSPGQGG